MDIYTYIRTERRSYYSRKGEALYDSSQATSIIVDGMDQKKTNLPHFKGWMAPKVSQMQVFIFPDDYKIRIE